MVFLKLSVIFCSFLILQTQAQPQDKMTQHQVANVSNIIDIIEFIVKIAEHIVDGFLDAIRITLETLIVEQNILQAKLIAVFEKIVDIIAVSADEQMNIMKEKGNADTKVIVGCIQEEEKKITTMVLDFFNKHSKCIVEELVTVQKSVKSIVGDLQKVQGDFKNALTKLDTCHGDDQNAITCALEVIVDTIKVVKEIPDITSEDIINLAELVIAFPKALLTCVKSDTDTFGTTIMEVIDDISTCSRKP